MFVCYFLRSFVLYKCSKRRRRKRKIKSDAGGGGCSEVNKLNINFLTVYFKCLITTKCSKCILSLHCVTIHDSGRNGSQCYHRGKLPRGDLRRGEIEKREMGKGESGRHRQTSSVHEIRGCWDRLRFKPSVTVTTRSKRADQQLLIRVWRQTCLWKSSCVKPLQRTVTP